RDEELVPREILRVRLGILIRGFGREEIRPTRHHRIVHFLERRYVHDPDRSPVRGSDQLSIARVNLEIMHRYRRQSCHEPLPARSTVRGYVSAHIRPHEKQITVDWIFADDVNEIRTTRRQIVDNRSERSAEIVRHVQVRMEIVLAMIIEGHVDRRRIEVRGLYAVYP